MLAVRAYCLSRKDFIPSRRASSRVGHAEAGIACDRALGLSRLELISRCHVDVGISHPYLKEERFFVDAYAVWIISAVLWREKREMPIPCSEHICRCSKFAAFAVSPSQICLVLLATKVNSMQDSTKARAIHKALPSEATPLHDIKVGLRTVETQVRCLLQMGLLQEREAVNSSICVILQSCVLLIQLQAIGRGRSHDSSRKGRRSTAEHHLRFPC